LKVSLKDSLSVIAQRSLTDCKKTVDDAMTSADCDDLTGMTSLKDAHLLTLACNHVPLRLPGRAHGTSASLRRLAWEPPPHRETFKFWSFLQSKSVNNVCKPRTASRGLVPNSLPGLCFWTPQGTLVWAIPPPKWKFLVQGRVQTGMSLNNPTEKHAGQESGEELCEVFKFW